MSLQLMKERIRVSGITPREEMIRDGQNLLKEELEHDVSYSPTMYFYDCINEKDNRIANLRIYGRKNSSLNGNYMNFLTTYDNPIKIGDYIHDTNDDTYWLVYTSFNVDDIHYEGKLIQCNYLLRWQLSDGKVVKRWANIVSASKYDTGENGNSTVILSSNNFTILIGYCDEGFELDMKRVFIDKKIPPEKVFKITRSDDVLYDSGNMDSLMSFIADKTELNKDKDNQKLCICDYIDCNDTTTSIPSSVTDTDKTVILSADITSNGNLKVGFYRTYIVNFTNENGETIDWSKINFSWDVNVEFIIEKIEFDNKIKLKVNDDSLIGESFLLECIVNDIVVGSIDITIYDVV